MLEHSEKEEDKTMIYIILFLFGIRAVIQFGFNFIRISSQGGGGPFLRYKMNNGQTVDINTSLEQKQIVKA